MKYESVIIRTEWIQFGAFNGGPRTPLLADVPQPPRGCYFIFCRRHRRCERVAVVMKWQHSLHIQRTTVGGRGRTGVARDEIWFLLRRNPEFIKLRFTYKRYITEIPQSYHSEWEAPEVVKLRLLRPYLLLFAEFMNGIDPGYSNACAEKDTFSNSGQHVNLWGIMSIINAIFEERRVAAKE